MVIGTEMNERRRKHSGAPKVAVVAEFYPSQGDPVLGVWAHRQALAARDAGAELRVLVLHRLVPPRASFADGPAGAARALGKLVREPRRQTHDGLEVSYVPYVSPPRAGSYASWGTWAAPALGLALCRLHRSFAFDLIHAHNAVPAAEAVRRARRGLRAAGDVPLVVSVHGGDVLYTAARPPTGSPAGAAAVARGLGAARLVLANSQGIAELARAHGAGETRVVHLGADLPARADSSRHSSEPLERTSPERTGRIGIPPTPPPPTLVTVAHLVARKRHADVLRALAVLSQRHPMLRYEIIGEGPERVALEGLATRLEIAERVEFHGQLAPAQAVARARRCTLFVMPSTEEAFGVAYVEAMAGGLPAIGCRGEPGPEEIAAVGDGFMLVPPGDIERLSQRIDELLSDPHRLREASQRARATVAASFTWERCGEQTLAAYEHALR
jgi:teichuronic acid biosynthesis glycosyltransferase TuaC